VEAELREVLRQKVDKLAMNTYDTSLNAPITAGKFEVKSATIGEIGGQFTSPTAVHGTIHLLLNPFAAGSISNFVLSKPSGREPFQCGTWDWSAKG